mmetsp:Transcript_13137/g.19799  ORF Transcript_13137/g.19799 Transcript_13137/m.19799 type:complete len:88 (+) Transcript_13137:193-456(+)|eukprot:CAMPEP_0184375970 /NCGR_PEP_ID=MMETSP0007-20130409/1028_1 /TAXON_ID=97485 /ORGANISM="Prymnesium parvum, Strain Texoma1" /LENGTH=87 /DNA_ID=CAMNT_0026719333 /DNA_START=191 /DNA_END=454 /DNA_ORIENTATION=-
MSGVEEVLAIVGAVKWIYDSLGHNAESERLVKKLERLGSKYANMDKRTNESKEVRDKLMMAKGAIQAKNGGEASRAIDGALAIAGLA